MVPTMLTLATGLLASPVPRPELVKGWAVEVRGCMLRLQAKPEARWVVEVQWPQPNAVPSVVPVESHYSDDLRAMFDGVKIDAIEARYHDDLRAVFEDLKNQKP
jgi:hypothetical protein